MRKPILLLATGLLSVSTAAFAMDRPASDWQQYKNSGRECISVGDFASAENNYRAAIAACGDKTAMPDLQVQYTNALLSQGKFDQASKELKKALSLSKSVSGADSYDYAEALDLQAWMFQCNGKMDDALASLKQSIDILSIKGPQTSDYADALEHMGLLSESLGLFDQAHSSYSKALEVRKLIAGPNSVEVADIMENLAHIGQRRGQQAQAPQLYFNALRIKESRGEPWKPYAPEPTERAVVFHFFPGAPNCAQGTMEGTLIEKIAANGIEIEAGISQKPSDFAKTTRALVRIKNNSQYDVDLLPKPATFIQITPVVQILNPLDPQTLATKIEKKGESKAKWIKFWGAQATDSLMTYGYQSGRGMPPMYGPPVYGYVPSSFGWQGGGGYGGAYGYNNFNNRGNRWSSSGTMITQVPDYQKREDAYRRAAAATSQSQTDATAIRDGALGPSRLKAGGYTEGALDFDFSKYKSAILRIPVGNAIYEFRFQ